MEENNVAERLLRAASVAANPTVEESSFSSLLQMTRRNFRRHSAPSNISTSRGRKKNHFLRKK